MRDERDQRPPDTREPAQREGSPRIRLAVPTRGNRFNRDHVAGLQDLVNGFRLPAKPLVFQPRPRPFDLCVGN